MRTLVKQILVGLLLPMTYSFEGEDSSFWIRAGKEVLKVFKLPSPRSISIQGFNQFPSVNHPRIHHSTWI